MTHDSDTSPYRYLISILVIVAAIPVILYRDFTPSNELRYLSIADEAIRNGTLFTFTNHGEVYADKPPLYLWIIMFCRIVAGKHCMWLLSLFSLIPAIIIANIMDSWSGHQLKGYGREAAMLTLLTSAYFLGGALTVRMDMLMLLFIVLALRSIWLLVKNPRKYRKQKWILPIWLFLAVFTKGPLGLLIPLVSSTIFLIFTGRVNTFFRYWGWRTWLVALVLCAVWFAGVYLEGGHEYLDNLLFHQTLDRAVNAFHHNRPFWYYCVSIWYILAPWSLLVAGMFIISLFPGFRKPDLPAYFISIAGSTFVLLSCLSGKLQIYMLPALPFFVYAAFIEMEQVRRKGFLAAALAVPALIFTLLLPAALYAANTGLLPDADLKPMLYIVTAILTAGGVWALSMLLRRLPKIDSTVIAMSTAMLAAVFAAGCYLPILRPLIGYSSLTEKTLKVAGQEKISDIRTWRVDRAENMDVYLGREVSVIDKDSVPACEDGRYLILVPKQDLYFLKWQKAYYAEPYAIAVMPQEPSNKSDKR